MRGLAIVRQSDRCADDPDRINCESFCDGHTRVGDFWGHESLGESYHFIVRESSAFAGPHAYYSICTFVCGSCTLAEVTFVAGTYTFACGHFACAIVTFVGGRCACSIVTFAGGPSTSCKAIERAFSDVFTVYDAACLCPCGQAD
jgi:hypothetical protein